MSLLTVILFAVVVTYTWHVYTTGKRARLPPGPTSLPLIGTLLQLPTSLPFLKFNVWAKEYGSLFTFHLLTQPVVVINDIHVAGDILDRMSTQTGDRPRLIKANDYLTRGRDIALMPRNDAWRQMRKAAHESLNTRTSHARSSLQEEEASFLVQGMLQSPEVSPEHHVHRLAASISMRALYGEPSIPLKGLDPSTRLQEIAAVFFAAMLPGRSVVDIFPPLRHIISRSKWLRRAADKEYEEATEDFLRFFHSESAEGKQCISATLRDEKSKHGMEDVDSAWLVGMLFMAAQDTTTIALRYFFLAMILHPEFAKVAQKQLDAVVGDRPPTFDDQSQLPYIEAIVKEVLRWRPPGPVGVAHSNSEDIHYEGYVIPKGTILIPNIWMMSRDPKAYPDGDTFNPDRFLTPEGQIRQAPPDTHDDWLAFGHGRRVCVGRDVAIHNLWICIAYLLWAFDFEKAKDEQGEEITPPDMEFIDIGITIFPAPFKFNAVPRFADLSERLQHHLRKDFDVSLSRVGL